MFAPRRRLLRYCGTLCQRRLRRRFDLYRAAGAVGGRLPHSPAALARLQYRGRGGEHGPLRPRRGHAVARRGPAHRYRSPSSLSRRADPDRASTPSSPCSERALLLTAGSLCCPGQAGGWRNARPMGPRCMPLLAAPLGYLAGLVGIGGGIFLAPLLHLARWNSARAIAATASLFILVNSLFGLAGQLLKGGAGQSRRGGRYRTAAAGRGRRSAGRSAACSRCATCRNAGSASAPPR